MSLSLILLRIYFEDYLHVTDDLLRNPFKCLIFYAFEGSNFRLVRFVPRNFFALKGSLLTEIMRSLLHSLLEDREGVNQYDFRVTYF